MLGVIEESHSNWASPIVLVPKTDGSVRFCVDYRKVNAVLKFDAYPMPRVDELLDRLGAARFYSTLDLTKGYWQIPLSPLSKEKTAFTTPFGLHQFVIRQAQTKVKAALCGGPMLYLSRKLSKRETRYSTVERECLAIWWAVLTLRYYLLGREFTLCSDHAPLQWLHRMKDTNARITRWYLALQPFKFKVVHRPGVQMAVADFLSRNGGGGGGGCRPEDSPA